MPKGLNLKAFGRRKSSGNALDLGLPADAGGTAPSEQSSFRVLERQDKKSVSYNNEKPHRPFASPLNTLRGKSVDDLGRAPKASAGTSTRNHSAWPLNAARGSGGTTNSGSSGFYESSGASARHSSTSTLPSSLDQDKTPEDDDLYPVRKTHTTTGMYRTVPPNADEPPPPPKFTSRALRTFSFGNKHNRGASRDNDVPPLPPLHIDSAPSLPPLPMQPTRSHSPFRERAMTNSSYASTAVPPRTELRLDDPDFGNDDFGSMFESLKKEPAWEPSPINTFHRTESEPMYPPRTHSRNALTPSPNPQNISRKNSNSPYSCDDESSNDGLLHSPALSSPALPDGGPSGTVRNGITQAFLGSSKSGYSRVPERYTSPGPEHDSQESLSGLMIGKPKEKERAYPNRQAHVEDEDRWVRKVELRDGPSPQLSTSSNKLSASSTGKQSLAGPSRGGAISPSSAGDSALLESNTTTPRAARKLNVSSEHSMFDSSPSAPASRAIGPGAGHQRTESGTIKKMTKAQFNALQRQNESSAEQSEEEEHSGDEYDDDDEIERARKMASQRQKQEANMSVYRQQMKKVTGGGPTDLPSSTASTVRPGLDQRSSSASVNGGGIGLHFGGIGGAPPEATQRGREDEDEDDDVPLGILQAHGFPSSSRPPTQQGENDLAHQRRTSASGSTVVGGGAGQGNLPPFARRLPADPYFGAGLVNASTRESLAMNGSGASVVGVPPSAPLHPMQQQMPPSMPQPAPMGHPGGLVGVIAGEERARAARRGSPNPAVLMGQNMPLPSNMNMPPMPRTMSMGNLPPSSVHNPSGYPPMPPMPLMPQMGIPGMMPMQMPQQQDPGSQQMQQLMQMQMQMMQNMLTMQQMQMGQPGSPSPQVQTPQQQQQTGDYLGVNFNQQNRRMSMASHASNQIGPPASLANQGRSMTMMSPPSGWGSAANPSGPRPNSAMPLLNGYAPSVQGLNLPGGAPANGYAPSIAPSERSNIGQPSRYRPVAQTGGGSRTQSMTSNLTLQAFQKQQTSPNLPGTPFNAKEVQTPKQTIRIVDKPKGAPKVAARPTDDDDDDGWAAMKKSREQKKKSKWGFKKEKSASHSTNEPALSEIYTNLD
ncbi:uncharacterized protein MYCFIDRAFT_86885 [Pseudocercospora fijiensis CIRAD86]|uniref:Uncharacterized protein n=1 Tax=Pseudocercospora fijiensis (strain CIRAD86) TaxID=383855 RepID=M3ATD8_PSEFD|nr:uncharacterized protein MYCFIDRAFT_86885 [Pseudocercospora fijiensis CIRAD86]EME80408.1 hypothetical protein MYCFIDRAFT_86885 [Pseudocercospora fijiensis CIRAD86]